MLKPDPHWNPSYPPTEKPPNSDSHLRGRSSPPDDKRGVVEAPSSLLNPNFRLDASLIFFSEYSVPNINAPG